MPLLEHNQQQNRKNAAVEPLFRVRHWTWKILKCGFWRRMEKISRTYCVTNKEVLHRVKKERNILQTIRRRKANLIGLSCTGTAF